MTGRAQWILAACLWVIAGLAFPLLTPATNFLSRDLQQFIGPATGMSDELAYRVTFTLVRVPLTVVLVIVITVVQCGVVPRVRSLARRWLTAAAIAACVATLIWLPVTLIATVFVGDTFPEPVRALLAMFGAALVAGFVSFTQRHTTRAAITVPGSFVTIGVVAAVLGALGGWAF